MKCPSCEAYTAADAPRCWRCGAPIAEEPAEDDTAEPVPKGARARRKEARAQRRQSRATAKAARPEPKAEPERKAAPEPKAEPSPPAQQPSPAPPRPRQPVPPPSRADAPTERRARARGSREQDEPTLTRSYRRTLRKKRRQQRFRSGVAFVIVLGIAAAVGYTIYYYVFAG